jgi:hypothetical protein
MAYLRGMEVKYAKPVRVWVEKWNGGMGQEGVAGGAESYEWHGLGLWKPDHYMVLDEFGKRQVMDEASLLAYYE